MGVGRKALPSNIHELKGSFKKNPQRKRDREFEPKALKPLGKPPAKMSVDERAAWLEIAKLAHPGVLCSADRFLVEMSARTLVLIRTTHAGNTPLLHRFQMFLAEMGMTPATRSRVSVAPIKEESEVFGSL